MHGLVPVALLVGLVAMACVPGGLAVAVLLGTEPNLVVYPYQYLMSANEQYSVVVRPDCNLVVYNFSQPFRATNFSNHAPAPSCSVWMQQDGNFGIYNFTGPDQAPSVNYSLWSLGYSELDGDRSFLLLGGDGSSYFYNTNSTPRQAPDNILYDGLENRFTGAELNYTAFLANSDPLYKAWKPTASLDDFPYMPAEYFLSAGKRLLTLKKAYALELGVDCNLRSKYFCGGTVYVLWQSWSARTDNRPCQLALQRNGNLQIRDTDSGVIYWNSTNSGSSNVSWILKVNPDNGNLTISDITNSSRILWTPPQTLTAQSVKKNSAASEFIVGVMVRVVLGALLLAMAALGLYFYARERFLDPSERAFQAKLRAKGGTSYAFSQAKIKQATENYKTVIGRGGFGPVFKGKLLDGQEVAAKVLSANSHQSKQEFYNEIELLSMVHHKYLVSLLGYSCSRSHQVLIYEYMGGGDLRHRLQGESGGENPLNWRQRTSIILQVAEGLEYLHDKCSPPIIHRDVKSTNILLTNQMVAKVADFGLSKLKTIGQEDATHISTVVKGTPGYMDPEYHETGMLTEKSDVYAFGIVLMEILTGRHHMYIAHTVGEAWKQEQFDGLADPNLGEDFDTQELVSFVELALWCVRRNSAERPLMRQVVRRLHDLGLGFGDSLEPLHPNIELGEEYDDEHCAMNVELITMGLEDFESETTF